jgi:hypothetical protein
MLVPNCRGQLVCLSSGNRFSRDDQFAEDAEHLFRPG